MGGCRRWLLLLGLVLLSGVLTGLPLPAAGQCRVRTDWPTIRVQRGDTLSRIARRYNTQVSVLTEANCLGSTRLMAGQTLHVPTVGASPTAIAGGRLPTSPGGSYSVHATYRNFQNGFMIWNSASGAVWVFNSGTGRVTEYPLAEYGGFQDPYDQISRQPGCFRPFFGFAKVWYYFPEVRDALGCATTLAETSFQMMMDMLPFGRTFTLILDNDHLPIRVGLDGSWQYQIRSDPTPLPTLDNSPRIGTTYQAFDNGFMIWLATSGDIYVYIGSETGVMETYASSQYAHLPVDTSRVIPDNHFQPQNGFGRVWSHFVRDRIGWPVSGETGYLMTPVYGDDGTIRQFNLPDGNYARRTDIVWQVSGRTIPTLTPTATFITQPTPDLTITPYPTPLPHHVGSTWAAYQPFVGGFMFWRQDTDEVYVFVQISSTGGWMRIFSKAVYESFPNPTDTPPSRGFVTPVNAFGKVWTQNEVRNNLGWATAPEQGYNATISDFLITGVKTIMYSTITIPIGGQVYANPLYSSWSWVNT